MPLIKWIEIAIVTGIPLAIWWMQKRLEEEKEQRIELLKTVQTKINNRAILLDKRIDLNDLAIANIKEKIDHKEEINVIKFNFVKDKIEDIESYLGKINGYIKKRHFNNSLSDKQEENFED